MRDLNEFKLEFSELLKRHNVSLIVDTEIFEDEEGYQGHENNIILYDNDSWLGNILLADCNEITSKNLKGRIK